MSDRSFHDSPYYDKEKKFEPKITIVYSRCPICAALVLENDLTFHKKWHKKESKNAYSD
jgi:hypothetical protein